MKIFEKGWFTLLVVILLCLDCWLTYFVLSKLGLTQKEIVSSILVALLALPITFLSITIPLNRTLAGKKEDEEEEVKKSYISAGIVIAPELLNNLQTLEEMKASIEKKYEIEESIKDKLKPEQLKTIIQMTAVQNVASEINLTLEDKYYLNAIASGIFVKTQDEWFTNDLQQAYIELENCKAKLRQIAIHFQMIISPPPGVPDAPIVAERMLRENAPDEVKIALKHMERAIEKIKKAIESMNRVLKPYDKQFNLEPNPETSESELIIEQPMSKD